jgi:hypothetical protein
MDSSQEDRSNHIRVRLQYRREIEPGREGQEAV